MGREPPKQFKPNNCLDYSEGPIRHHGSYTAIGSQFTCFHSKLVQEHDDSDISYEEPGSSVPSNAFQYALPASVCHGNLN
ncbi:hypothetical protein STEG23_001842 [Scotinomys teguina]